MNKRDFLKSSLYAGAGICLLPVLSFCEIRKPGEEENDSEPTGIANTDARGFLLPPLPYAYHALEPIIDRETMELHYSAHHTAYTKNLNEALKAYPQLQTGSIESLLHKLDGSEAQKSLRDNAGGYYNHLLFWKIMSPEGGGEAGGDLAKAIDTAFGSFAAFRKKFTEAAMSVFGSGWAWLCRSEDGKLFITKTPNQDSPLMQHIHDEYGYPLLGIDVWEHAYYLNYQNKRAEYVEGFFDIIHWKYVEKLFAESPENFKA